MAVAVAIDAVFQHIGRQELRLADFAVRCAARVRAQVAALDEGQRRVELVGEIVGTAAVEGQRRYSRQRVFLAHEAAETGFHAPDRDDRAGRNAVTVFNGIEESGVLRLHLLAARNNRLTATLLHELAQRQLEALLPTVGADGRLVVGDVGEGLVQHRRADAAAGGFALEILDPGVEACRCVAALRSRCHRWQDRCRNHRRETCQYAFCLAHEIPRIARIQNCDRKMPVFAVSVTTLLQYREAVFHVNPPFNREKTSQLPFYKEAPHSFHGSCEAFYPIATIKPKG